MKIENAMKTNSRLGVSALFALFLLTALPLTASAQRVLRHGSVTWSGDVDDTAIVTVHQSSVRTQVLRGKSSGNVNAQFLGRLPSRPVRLLLLQRRGRGQIRIVEQPNAGNNFTGRVRIHDPQAGSGFYSFVLSWRPPRFGGAPRSRHRAF